MTDREAMQQALDALTRIWEDGLENYPVWAHEAAIDNLRERLAQPEQEPLQFKCTVIDDAHPNGVPLEQWGKQPEQEPVAHVYLFEPNGRPRVAWDNANNIKIGDKLYTTPPQRRPLTDEQLEKLMMDYGYDADDEFMKEMLKEAAHGIKEKNA